MDGLTEAVQYVSDLLNSDMDMEPTICPVVDLTNVTRASEELDDLLGLCRENGISLNDYLVARMMIDEGTDKVIIASDIRNKIKNYKKGALGNYATAFGVVVKKKSSEIMELAKAVNREIRNIISKPDKEMLVLGLLNRI